MRIGIVGTFAALLLATAGQCYATPGREGIADRRQVTLRMLPSGSLVDAASQIPGGHLELRSATPSDMLLSLALPGLGELRTGHRNRAVLHLAAEAAVWTTFLVFRVQGGLRKDDYIEYAQVYAGVQEAHGQSDGYYRDLARFRRSDPGPMSYNELQVRSVARDLFPEDLEAQKRYIEEHEIRGARAWDWETEENWRTYGSMRESSELSYQRSRFAVAAAIANRIASVLGLARTRGPGDSRIDVGMMPVAGGGGYYTTISLSKQF